jgi:hypothetical protein
MPLKMPLFSPYGSWYIQPAHLEGIGPAGKVGVPAIGLDERAVTGLHLSVIVGFPLQVGFASLNVELRVLPDPGMIDGGVLGDEVYDKLEPSFLEALLQTKEINLPAEIPVQAVTRHRKGRTADVRLGEIRKRRLKFLNPLGVAQGHPPPRRPGLPEAQEPDIVEAQGNFLVEELIGNIGQRRRPSQTVRKSP